MNKAECRGYRAQDSEREVERGTRKGQEDVLPEVASSAGWTGMLYDLFLLVLLPNTCEPPGKLEGLAEWLLGSGISAVWFEIRSFPTSYEGVR